MISEYISMQIMRLAIRNVRAFIFVMGFSVLLAIDPDPIFIQAVW